MCVIMTMSMFIPPLFQVCNSSSSSSCCGIVIMCSLFCLAGFLEILTMFSCLWVLVMWAGDVFSYILIILIILSIHNFFPNLCSPSVFQFFLPCFCLRNYLVICSFVKSYGQEKRIVSFFSTLFFIKLRYNFHIYQDI